MMTMSPPINTEDAFRIIEESGEKRDVVTLRLKPSIVKRFRTCCKGNSPAKMIEVLMYLFCEDVEKKKIAAAAIAAANHIKAEGQGPPKQKGKKSPTKKS